MHFTEKDKECMQMAIEGAHEALASGDFPVGAVLLVNSEFVGKARNFIRTNDDRMSHAEIVLLNQFSSKIKNSLKDGHHSTLYTSLEPCLMCLGSAVMHRVSKIIYACPDPYTGATSLNKASLPDVYARLWPEVEGGLMREQSYSLVVEFMVNQGPDKWKESLRAFRAMQKSW